MPQRLAEEALHFSGSAFTIFEEAKQSISVKHVPPGAPARRRGCHLLLSAALTFALTFPLRQVFLEHRRLARLWLQKSPEFPESLFGQWS